MRVESVGQWQLRASFARRLSDMYGREVPAYTTLVRRLARGERRRRCAGRGRRRAPGQHRAGSRPNVTARSGSAPRPRCAQVARIFGGAGHAPGRLLRPARGRDQRRCRWCRRRSGRPTGRAGPQPVPGVHLHADHRGPAVLRAGPATPAGGVPRPPAAVRPRTARAGGPGRTATAGCSGDDAETFLAPGHRGVRAVAPNRSTGPGTTSWRQVSGGRRRHRRASRTTHINHLTPRVLDIDELYAADDRARRSR